MLIDHSKIVRFWNNPKVRCADKADTQTLARKLATSSKRRACGAYPELKKALRFEASTIGAWRLYEWSRECRYCLSSSV